jgi:uncharacterized protein YuzE
MMQYNNLIDKIDDIKQKTQIEIQKDKREKIRLENKTINYDTCSDIGKNAVIQNITSEDVIKLPDCINVEIKHYGVIPGTEGEKGKSILISTEENCIPPKQFILSIT